MMSFIFKICSLLEKAIYLDTLMLHLNIPLKYIGPLKMTLESIILRLTIFEFVNHAPPNNPLILTPSSKKRLL